jgi:hypothetical protein
MLPHLLIQLYQLNLYIDIYPNLENRISKYHNSIEKELKCSRNYISTDKDVAFFMQIEYKPRTFHLFTLKKLDF